MPLTLAQLGQEMPPQQPNSLNLSMLEQMLQTNQQRMAPQFQWRLLDPGMTWGGQDKNAVQPDDYMNSIFSVKPQEDI